MKNELIETYFKGVEEAIKISQENGFNPGIIKGMEMIKDGLLELDSLINSEADLKRVKADCERILDELLKSAKDRNEPLTLGNMRTLRDRVNTLKAIFKKIEFK